MGIGVIRHSGDDGGSHGLDDGVDFGGGEGVGYF